MDDYIVRAIAADGTIRAFAAYTRNTVEKARSLHNTSPVVTAALGRLLTAGAMMGSMMKGDKDVITLRMEGSGPMKSLLVTADSHGNVKGYPGNPVVLLPANSAGKLDVAGAIGVGVLTVIKDIGMKEPYSGTCELVSGEIAEDITYYYASSEQTPSSVGLGVLMTPDNTVNVAGGFIIQVMPDATEETIDKIEHNMAQISSVTTLLESGKTPEDILNTILDGLAPEMLGTMPVGFNCNCSRQRVESALALINRKEIEDMIADNEPIEIKCHFFNTSYKFEVEDLKKLCN